MIGRHMMNWSTTRQLLFALALLAVVVVVSVVAYFVYFYSPPSCSDRTQNQNEEGVDCGGECSLLCVAPNITTLWARSVQVAPGVYHAVALIKNPNTSAAGTVPYSVSLFDEANILIAVREGTLRLLPGDIAPLFEANIVTGERPPAKTFIDIGEGRFEKAERGASPVRVLSWDFEPEQARLIATLENQSPVAVGEVIVPALLMDSTEFLINASQTTLDGMEPHARVEVVFTWQEPFVDVPTRIDIIPRLQSTAQ